MAERTEEQIKEIWDILRETAQSARETDRRMQETDKRIRDLDKQIADLTGSWSKFVESMVEPAVVRLFTERGIEIEGTYQRVKKRRDGNEMEIDILGINKECVVAVEVKTTLKVEDVNKHIERLDRFRNFFPEYADRKLIGAVAGMRIEEESDKYAYRKGFFVLAQSGENVIILNDEKFRPKVW
jgi:DNA-binding transcriptional MerR regulator